MKFTQLIILFQYDFESLKPDSDARLIMQTNERLQSLKRATNRRGDINEVVHGSDANQSQSADMKELDIRLILLQEL